jgi:hypothetical protein
LLLWGRGAPLKFTSGGNLIFVVVEFLANFLLVEKKEPRMRAKKRK